MSSGRRLFPPGRRLEIARHLGEPLRERFGLPVGTNLDALLVAAYYRTFVTDRVDDPPIVPAVAVGSPFQAGPVVAAAGVADSGRTQPSESPEAVR